MPKRNELIDLAVIATDIKYIKDEVTDIKTEQKSFLSSMNIKNKEDACRFNVIENRITAVEIRSGIFGTIGGFCGALIAGLLNIFK